MAYVLGFFCADGSMFINPRGAHYIALYSNDRHIIEFIRDAIGSEHKISSKPPGRGNRKHEAYFLQLGSKEMYQDLLRLGLMPAKARRLSLPKIPGKYFAVFVRGFFDGDGNVSSGHYVRRGRRNATRVFSVRFTSASRRFLVDLAQSIKEKLSLSGFIHRGDRAWYLGYSTLPSIQLLRFIYKDGIKKLPILERKYKRFLSVCQQ